MHAPEVFVGAKEGPQAQRATINLISVFVDDVNLILILDARSLSRDAL